MADHDFGQLVTGTLAKAPNLKYYGKTVTGEAPLDLPITPCNSFKSPSVTQHRCVNSQVENWSFGCCVLATKQCPARRSSSECSCALCSALDIVSFYRKLLLFIMAWGIQKADPPKERDKNKQNLRRLAVFLDCDQKLRVKD